MKNKLNLLVLLVLALFPFTSKASDYKVIGYFADWTSNANSMLDNINYDALTHINYAFAIPNQGNGYISVGNSALLKKMVTKAHAAGVKVNLSLGGASASYTFQPICADNTLRTRLIDSTTNFIKKYDLDGLDLDWEFPTNSAEMTMLENLLKDFRIKFDGIQGSYRYIELSVASNPTDYYGHTLTDDAITYLDYLNIMDYDGSAPHHSSVNYAETGLDYWISRGVPASMLILGVPFYSKYSGVGYNSSSYRTFSNSNPSGAFNDDDGYFDVNGYTHDYNSKPILVEKADLIKNVYHSGGMMIWELTQDRTDQYSLLDVIGTEMETSVGTKEVKEVQGIVSYPNPFNEETYIDLRQLKSNDANVVIEISDVSGKVIYSQQHSSNQVFVFNQNISAGMYFCKINDSKVTYNTKLIKE